MQNRVIALLAFFMSVSCSLFGVNEPNFLQNHMKAKTFKALTVEAMAQEISMHPELLNQVGKDGETPFFTAFDNSRFDLVGELIKLGADIVNEKREDYKEGLLIELIGRIDQSNPKSTSYNYEERVKQFGIVVAALLEKDFRVSNKVIEEIVGINQCKSDAVKEIITNIIKKIKSTHLTELRDKKFKNYNNEDCTLLEWVTAQKMDEAQKWLVDNTPRPNFLQKHEDADTFEGLTVEKMTQEINAYPPNERLELLNQVGEEKSTPYLTARDAKRFDLVGKLIELGAQITDKDKENLFIRLINQLQTLKPKSTEYVYEDKIKDLNTLVAELFRKGAVVSDKVIKKIVITACKSDAVKEVITNIIEHIQDINLINKEMKDSDDEKTTLLHWTVKQNMPKASARLIFQGADLALVDSSKCTALSFAMEEGSRYKSGIISSIVEHLPDNHSLINKEIILKQSTASMPAEKVTFLMAAAENLDKDVCELLIKKGASVTRTVGKYVPLASILKNFSGHETDKNEHWMLPIWEIVFLLWEGHENDYSVELIPFKEAVACIQFIPAINMNIIKKFTSMINAFIKKINFEDDSYKAIFTVMLNKISDSKDKVQFLILIDVMSQVVQKSDFDINRLSSAKKTPLHAAIEVFSKKWCKESWFDIDEYAQLIQRILNRKPDLTIKNVNKQGPLHYAVSLVLENKITDASVIPNFLKILSKIVQADASIKDALTYLEKQELHHKDKPLCYSVAKAIIQDLNNDQIAELYDVNISSFVIDVVCQNDDLEMFKLLKKYKIDLSGIKPSDKNVWPNIKLYLTKKNDKKAQEDEKARKAEEARLEADRLEKERLAEEARKAELARLEAERIAEEARKAKEAKKAEKARLAEEARLEKERLAKEEADRLEVERKAKVAAKTIQSVFRSHRAKKAKHEEKIRRAEEARKAEEVRLEKERVAKEEAARLEAERLAEAARLKAEKKAKKTSGLGAQLNTLKNKLTDLQGKLKGLAGVLTTLKGKLSTH